MRAPLPCDPSFVFKDRMIAVCCRRDAILGISSDIRTPGTLVPMSRKGPPVGRPGLGSQVSN